jgi:hypothetical protein
MELVVVCPNTIEFGENEIGCCMHGTQIIAQNLSSSFQHIGFFVGLIGREDYCEIH